jgi:hypothetical protein
VSTPVDRPADGELDPAAGAAPLTILSTPKAFRGLFAVIQRNAITSWTQLHPRPEIILFGADEGTAEICEELRLRHVPEVATTDEGTPLVSDMFLQGQALATTPLVCWSNADVIFTDRLLEAAATAAAHPRPVYLVGQRTDIDQSDPLDFAPGWQACLEARAHAHGERKPVNWIDYFLFTRGLFTELPPFAIGRPGYDPWLIWKAADLGADVIDATAWLPAIHQRHDYSHVGKREDAFNGAEAKRNAAIVDDWRHYHSISYARLALDEHGRIGPATRLHHRLARPRTYLGHALRFTRPLRRRLLGEQATWRRRRATAPAG